MTTAPALPSSFSSLVALVPEPTAVEFFERLRWPDGARCTHCDSLDVKKTWSRGTKRKKRIVWDCRKCGGIFSVTTGTVMEDTKLPLSKWLYAFHLLNAAKHGISSLQLARMLHVSTRTAWHLSHRIREAMRENSQFFSGEVVETDETYIGGKRRGRGRGYRGNKIAVQTIVGRGYGPIPGQAQTMALRPADGGVDGRTVGAKLRKHTDPDSTVLMTDDSPIYTAVGKSFQEHHSVNHSKKEYVRAEEDGHLSHTNTAEGLFANLKRQITGTHHHTSKKHLPRYLEEYDHKDNTRDLTDDERVLRAILGGVGRRVTLFRSKIRGADFLIDRPVPETESPEQRLIRRMKRRGDAK